LKSLLIFVAWGGLVTQLAVASPVADIGYVAYGDLRGHLEPCGCDPETDLGGIKRIAIAIDRERSAHPDMGVFNLGNNLPQRAEGDLKVPFLLEADAREHPTASLLNVLELEHLQAVGAFERSQVGKELAYVLSNARDPATTRVAAPVVAAGNFVVLGYTWSPEVARYVERVDARLLASWRGKLAASGGRYHVLLFSGNDADLQKIIAAKLFQTIISSNTSPMTAVPGVAERRDESRLKRRADPPVNAVPLGGQGLLRGGTLLFDEVKPLAAYLKNSKTCVPDGKPVGSLMPTCGPGEQQATFPFKEAKLITWLDPKTASGDSPLDELYGRFAAAARQAFLGASAVRLKDLKTSPFAGAKACSSCHAEPYRIYLTTKHAHAMADLKAKGKHEDAECVACHAVGAKAKGGYVSLTASPQLANVQCENCHGAAKAHAADPTKVPMPKIDRPQVCLQCHNGQHSPKFDAEGYWHRIVH